MFARLTGRPGVAVIRVADAVAGTVLFAARAARGFKTDVRGTYERDGAAGAYAYEGSRKQRRQMRPHKGTPISKDGPTGAQCAAGRLARRYTYERASP
jgi:hypothetical protein